MTLLLAQAQTIVTAALAEARRAGMKPLVVTVLDARGTGVPAIVHWGADLGDLDPAMLTALADASVPAISPSFRHCRSQRCRNTSRC